MWLGLEAQVHVDVEGDALSASGCELTIQPPVEGVVGGALWAATTVRPCAHSHGCRAYTPCWRASLCGQQDDIRLDGSEH